jgi:hypothetical protein
LNWMLFFSWSMASAIVDFAANSAWAVSKESASSWICRSSFSTSSVLEDRSLVASLSWISLNIIYYRVQLWTFLTFSSSSFVSIFTSWIEDIEGLARVVVVVAAAPGRVAVALAVIVGFATVGATLETEGARFTPSETDARGREATDDADPAGETTDGRVEPAEAGCFMAELPEGTLEDAVVPVGRAGTTDCLREVPVVDAAETGAREVVPGALALDEVPLVDFCNPGAGRTPVAVGLEGEAGPLEAAAEGAVFAAPAPKVPELIPYRMWWEGFYTWNSRMNLLTFLITEGLGSPLAVAGSALDMVELVLDASLSMRGWVLEGVMVVLLNADWPSAVGASPTLGSMTLAFDVVLATSWSSL